MQQILDVMNRCGVEPYEEETHTGLVRHVLIRYGFTSKEIMVCFVLNGRSLPHAELFLERLTDIEGMTSITINVNMQKTNVILGEELITLWGQPYITDELDGISFQISPLSFYQVNPQQTVKLYRTALEYADLHGTETVWDLYCGIGTISLFLSQKAGQVYGVEIVPQAIEDARKNAQLNNIENVQFFVGKAEEVVPEFYQNHPQEQARHPEIIVVDPPRKGCDEVLLQTMCEMSPQRIVYVSCDSATLARDLKYLLARGYEFVKGRAVDQFGHSVHCEAVVLLSKKD
jgi:23S rRNA (uracil1939-C5)-methyltransferase